MPPNHPKNPQNPQNSPKNSPSERPPADQAVPRRKSGRRQPGYTPPGGLPPLPPSEPLILDRVQLTAGLTPGVARPGTAAVYIDAENNYVKLAVTPKQGLLPWKTKYRWRIDVDTSLRQDELWDSIPTQTPPAKFYVYMTVEWSVTDPVRLVRRNLEDGRQIVFTRLFGVARELGWAHPIDQAQVLEGKLNAQLNRPHEQFEEGITVHRCAVRISVDSRSEEKLVRIDDHRLERSLEESELVALRSTIKDESDLFLLYLARDRDRVGDLINDMRKNDEIKNERVLALFQQAVERGVMQSAEVNEMLQRLLVPLQGILHPRGHADILGTQRIPLPDLAPQPPPILPGVVTSIPEEIEEDVTPQQVREDGVQEWSDLSWDS
jgi:hypothetical protein